MDNRTFLGKRRDRALATLLGFKEREVDRFLDEKTPAKLRDQILYHFKYFFSYWRYLWLGVRLFQWLGMD